MHHTDEEQTRMFESDAFASLSTARLRIALNWIDATYAELETADPPSCCWRIYRDAIHTCNRCSYHEASAGMESGENSGVGEQTSRICGGDSSRLLHTDYRSARIGVRRMGAGA
jgi:hypothetical protein